MTENEAVEKLQEKYMDSEYYFAENDEYEKDFDEDLHKAYEIAISALKEIQKYRELGTVEELREAMEKQRAKKPIRNDMCTCPSCGTYNETVKKRRNTVNQDIVYCWHCGQAMEIKRSEEE